MWQFRLHLTLCAWLSICAVVVLVLPSSCAGFQPPNVEPPKYGELRSKFYDWGLLHGLVPRQSFKSFSLEPPEVNFVQWDKRCDDGHTFISPRGHMVPHPGPIIMDARGELVWMEDRYGQAMDFKVQQYRGHDYLTFWTGEDSGTFGTGSYVMVRTNISSSHTGPPKKLTSCFF